uniref:Uncharacterized protein n=1 Tax=Solanum tuberosum TaxID=4113 RepID=M1DSV7_SOLTU
MSRTEPRLARERGRKTKTIKLIADGIGSTWFHLERVNPSPSPTHLARVSEWAKVEAVLKAATRCSRETESIRDLTKSKAAERITSAQEKSKGIEIKDDAITSQRKASKLPTTIGKGKGKRPTSARKTITLDPNIPSWTLIFLHGPGDFAERCMSFWQTHT